MANGKQDDELLRRARELGQKAEQLQEDSRRNHTSSFERQVRDSAWFRKITSAVGTLGKYLGPVGSLLAWLIGLSAKWFRWAAIQPGDPDGHSDSVDAEFSWRRFSFNTTLSVAALFAVHVALAAIYYYSTYFHETVYVTGKQEIETGELYQFGGCTSLPCSTDTDNGKFYLIESSLYFPVMYYPEENVFANIPQQDAACHVQGYGIYFRTLRWLYKSAQLYQHVVNVSCRPYTEEEIRRAVDEGVIVKD